MLIKESTNSASQFMVDNIRLGQKFGTRNKYWYQEPTIISLTYPRLAHGLL